ncbi:MAG: hypothetical protein ACK5YI_03620 [Rhodospirillales bacterium]|jgi:hypothetical protein
MIGFHFAAQTMASQPQFAVQRPKGRGWKTLHSGPDRAAAERFFETAKGQLPVLRLIEVAVEAADENATDYRWKLITLHDGRATWTGPVGGGKGKGANARGAGGRSQGGASRPGARDGTRVPVRLYLVVLAVGLAIGAAVSLVLGLRQP